MTKVEENGHASFDEEDSIHFEPIVTLPKVDIKTYEEEEDVLFKIRAKLFRLDQSLDPNEWKERGIGDVKISQHKVTKHIRVLMYREKVLKLCANHTVMPDMELMPNIGSDRAWLWNVPCDYADGESKPEMFAIRFANSENAQLFKDHFDKARTTMKDILIEKEDSECNGKNDDHDEQGTGEKENPDVQETGKNEDTDGQKTDEATEEIAGVLSSLQLKSDVTNADPAYEQGDKGPNPVKTEQNSLLEDNTKQTIESLK